MPLPDPLHPCTYILVWKKIKTEKLQGQVLQGVNFQVFPEITLGKNKTFGKYRNKQVASLGTTLVYGGESELTSCALFGTIMNIRGGVHEYLYLRLLRPRFRKLYKRFGLAQVKCKKVFLMRGTAVNVNCCGLIPFTCPVRLQRTAGNPHTHGGTAHLSRRCRRRQPWRIWHKMPTLRAEIPAATLWPLSARGPPW